MKKKIRPWVQLLLVVAQAIFGMTIIRLTAGFCVGVCCKYAATSLVEVLFSHHAWTLNLLLRMLDFSLVVFCIHFGLKTLEEDLKLPATAWLESLYNSLMPKVGPAEPEPPPAKPQQPAGRKAVVVKRRKPRARRLPAGKATNIPRPAKVAPEVTPAAVPRHAEPKLAPPQEKNQAIDE